jgi:ribosome biogenesis protein MAK21
MALQSESLDDELEHFEDVIEETDKEPVTVSDKEPATVSDKPSEDIVLVQNGEVANSDKDSSDGEDDDQPASSEDDDDDLDDALEDEDFSLAKSKKNHKKSKKLNSETDNEGQKSQESIKKPLLPGGYDPRHREPSYW